MNIDKSMQIKILLAQKKSGKSFNLTVTGYSMNPTLYESDITTIVPSEICEIGDIVVFVYNQNELLVHRLLEKKGDVYYCKGDNALRIEKISIEQIIGKVIDINRDGQRIPLLPCSDKFFALSKAVNKEFFKCRYNPVKTRAAYIYKLYEKIVIKKEEIEVYTKNEKMDYIDSDENSMAVFDPDSGDTHFLDEIGTDIIKILEQPHDFETIVSRLCEIYSAEPGDIQNDLKEFFDDTVKKGIVMEL